MKNFYLILGVTKTATLAEIKKQYRILANKYHPDKNPDNKEAEEKFKEIAEAYACLSNEKLRAEFDMLFSEQQAKAANTSSYASSTKISLGDFLERVAAFAAIIILLGAVASSTKPAPSRKKRIKKTTKRKTAKSISRRR